MSSRRSISLFACSLLVIGSAACADGPGAAGGEEGPEEWVAVPDLRIGALDDSIYGLTRPSGVAVDEDGTIYSAHGSESKVRVWTADGRHVRDIGGPGEGPGEFQGLGGVGFFGDTLWTFDFRQYRTTYFDRDGELLGVVTTRPASGGGDLQDAPPRPSVPLRDGRYLGTPPIPSHLVATGEITSAPFALMTAEGEVVDTAYMASFGTDGTLALLRDGGGTFTRQPFTDAEIRAVDNVRGEVVVVHRKAAAEPPGRGRVTVVRLEADGDTIWSREMRFDVEPVTDAQADSAVDAIAGRLHEWIGERTGQSLSDFRKGVREALYLPPHHAAVTGARMGRDGTVWLALGAGPGTPEGGEAWRVLAPDGSDAGTVVLPEGLGVLEADLGHVWGVETDELDVPYLVRYLIVPADRP